MKQEVSASKVRHLPRRSGVGARRVIKPAKQRPPRLRRREGAPWTCGMLDPDRPGVVDDRTGEWLIDPVYCTARVWEVDENGEPIPHRGQHRARLLSGVLYRWSDAAPTLRVARRFRRWSR